MITRSLIAFSFALVCSFQRTEGSGMRNPGLLAATIPLIGTTTFTLIYSLFAETDEQKDSTEVRNILNNEILTSGSKSPRYDSAFGTQIDVPRASEKPKSATTAPADKLKSQPANE